MVTVGRNGVENNMMCSSSFPAQLQHGIMIYKSRPKATPNFKKSKGR